MTGRPSIYTDELVDLICDRIASGESLRMICSEPGMPAQSSVYLWLSSKPGFSEKYAHARAAQADVYAQEIVDIADMCEDPAKARLQMDARKWAASKLAPKKYGDKLDLNHGGQPDNPVTGELRITFVDGD